MAPLFFKIFQKYTPGVSSVNSQHLSVVFAYGHTTLRAIESYRKWYSKRSKEEEGECLFGVKEDIFYLLFCLKQSSACVSGSSNPQTALAVWG